MTSRRWALVAGAPLLSGCPAHPPQSVACEAHQPTCALFGGSGVTATALWDGGLADGGASTAPVGEQLDDATCARLCTCASSFTWCRVSDVDLVDCGNTCIGGRVPPGLRGLSGVDGSAGSWLARMAELEAAAVHAFLHLAKELDAHGLPAFAGAALAAAEDELRHADAVTRLALRHGLCPRPVAVGAPEVRSLEAPSVDNAGEGCGRELFGAAVNRLQGGMAGDVEVRGVMGAIAGDEAAHARLSLALAGALMPRLTVAQRRRAREAQAGVLSALGADGEVPPAARVALGLPDAPQAAALARALLDARRV